MKRTWLTLLAAGLTLASVGCESGAESPEPKGKAIVKAEAPIVVAVKAGERPKVEQLLGAGADANATGELGNSALWWAVRGGNAEIAVVLIDRGADVNAPNMTGTTPLFWAAEGGSLKIATLLLDRGADPNLSSKLGDTPLMSAASVPGENLELVRLLIDRGADVNATVTSGPLQGSTALSFATQYGRDEIAKVLREAGATR